MFNFFVYLKERGNVDFMLCVISTTYQENCPHCESYDDLAVQFAVEEENLSCLEK